jgi:hypothetical protein
VPAQEQRDIAIVDCMYSSMRTNIRLPHTLFFPPLCFYRSLSVPSPSPLRSTPPPRCRFPPLCPSPSPPQGSHDPDALDIGLPPPQGIFYNRVAFRGARDDVMVRPLSVAVFRWLRRHQSTVVDGPGGEGYAYDEAYGDGGAGGGGAGGGGGYGAQWAQRGPGGRGDEYEATSSEAYGASSSSSSSLSSPSSSYMLSTAARGAAGADADAESAAASGVGSNFDVQEIPAYLPTAQEAELMEEERARKERASRGPGVYILYGYCARAHTHTHTCTNRCTLLQPTAAQNFRLPPPRGAFDIESA